MLALPKYRVHGGGRLTLHGWSNVAVEVQRDADPTVPSRSETILGCTPSPNSNVAAVWRRS